MGKREMKNRLLYPLLNHYRIQIRYNKIEFLRFDKKYDEIRDNLKDIGDLDKSLRLMSLNMIEQNKMKSSYLSYKLIEDVLEKIRENRFIDFYNINTIYESHHEAYSQYFDKFHEFVKEMEDIFNFKNITNESIEQCKRSIFKYGQFDKIDLIDTEIELYNERIEIAATRLSKYIDDKEVNSLKVCVMGKHENE